MEEGLCFVPHLSLKNAKVEVNFGQQQYPWHSPPDTFHLINQPEVNCRLIPNPRVQVSILTGTFTTVYFTLFILLYLFYFKILNKNCGG